MARPTKQNATDTRRLALEGMAELIQQYGYKAASMSSVAKQIGIRKASLYHHFPEGKEQMVAEMLTNMLDGHASAYQGILGKGATVSEKLIRLIEFNLLNNSELSHMMSDSLRFLSGTYQERLGEMFTKGQFLPIKLVLDEAVRTGELREHDTALSSWMFLSLMGEMNRLESYVSRQKFPEMLVSLFLKGIER